MAISISPKNKEIENVLDRLIGYPVARCPPELGMSLGRNKKIRYLREKDYIFIGQDRNKRKSIISIPHKVKIKKRNGKFFFEF